MPFNSYFRYKKRFYVQKTDFLTRKKPLIRRKQKSRILSNFKTIFYQIVIKIEGRKFLILFLEKSVANSTILV